MGAMRKMQIELEIFGVCVYGDEIIYSQEIETGGKYHRYPGFVDCHGSFKTSRNMQERGEPTSLKAWCFGIFHEKRTFLFWKASSVKSVRQVNCSEAGHFGFLHELLIRY
jgi:hypothetical protein